MGAKESAMTPPPASHAAQPRRPSGRPTPRAPDPAPAWPESSARWRKQYDVYVCSSERDLPYAKDLVTYLQEQPERLRCFLPARDMNYGGAIPTELTEGAESSHCWVMLMSPEFLEEQWCHYQMLQFLTLAPFPDGRLIPVLLGLGMDKYPKELKLFYAFKSAPGERAVFGSVRMAVLTHLRKLPTIPSDQTPSDTTSSSALEGRSSSSPGVSSRREESTGNPPARNESSSDGSARSSETRGVTKDIAMSVIKSQQESTGDPSPRCSSLVESPSDASVRSARAQRHSSERSSESQEPTNQPFMNPEALGDTAPTTVVSQWSTTTKQELISEGSRMQGSTKQELISGGSRMQGSTKQELISEGSRMQGSTQRELISEGSRVQGSTKQGPISEDSRMQGFPKRELISEGSRMQGFPKRELISEGSRMQGSTKQELISDGSRMQGSTKQELISEGSRVQGSTKQGPISEDSRMQGFPKRELISEGSRMQGSTKQELISEGSRMQGSTKRELISEGSRVPGFTKQESILAKDFLGQETPAGSFSRSSMTQQSPSEKGSSTTSLVGSSMEKATSNTATKVFMTRQISGDTPVSSSMQRLTGRSIALGPTGDDSRSRTDLLMSNVDLLAPNTNISDVTRKTLDCRTSAGIGAGLNPFAKEAAGRSSKKLSPNLDSCCPWMDIYSSSGGAQDDNLYTSHSEIQMNEDSHPPHGDIYRSCIGMTSQSHEEPPSLQRDLYTSDGGQMEKLDIQSLRGDDMEKVLRNCRRGGYTGCPGSWAGEQPPQRLQRDLYATRGPNKMERRDALYLQSGEGTQAEDGDPLQLLEDIYVSSGGTDGPDLKGDVHGGTHTVNSCRYLRDETENEASQVLGCINNTNCDGRKDFCCPHTNSMLTKAGSSRSFYTGQRGSDLGTPQSDFYTSFSGERGYEHPPLLPRDLLPGSRGGTVLDRSCSRPQRDLYTGHVGNEASGVLLGLHGPVLTANQNCHGNGHRNCWEAGCTSRNLYCESEGAQGNVSHIYRGNADACEEPAKSFIQADKLASEAADKT